MGVSATVPILPGAALTKSALMRSTPKAGATGPLGPWLRRGCQLPASAPERLFSPTHLKHAIDS